MACNKWEEMGLLFSSGELSEEERRDFETHMLECSECTAERETYNRERKQFFSIDILGEDPSASCGAEILRVCSQGRKRLTAIQLFPLLLRKSAVSLALFLVGFTVVGYLTVRMDFSNESKSASNTIVNGEKGALHSVLAADEAANKPLDSAVDSSRRNSINFANQRGNLNLKGVYPVDLQNNDLQNK